MLVEIFKTVLSALRSVFRSRAALLAEDVFLRQQIIVLQRSVAKPRIRRWDRIVLAFAVRTFDIHAQIVETDFEAAYGFLSQRLRKRSLVVLFTQVADEVSARSVVRTVRGLGPRHLPLAAFFRDEALDLMAEPRGTPTRPAELY